MAVSIVRSFYGAGQILSDPFWQPNPVDKMIYQNHITFAAQLLNVYGIWVVKLSICANLPTHRSQTGRIIEHGDSDKAILEEIEIEQTQRGSEIVKTTQIRIGYAL
jgi:hypothetical protein